MVTNPYEESLDALKVYLSVVKVIPTEKEWNHYAREQNLLSSKSLEYYYGSRFNQMCKKLIKKRKKRSPKK